MSYDNIRGGYLIASKSLREQALEICQRELRHAEDELGWMSEENRSRGLQREAQASAEKRVRLIQALDDE